MHSCYFINILFLVIFNYPDLANCFGEVIYAINAGGEAHVDSDGIHYRRDPLHGRIGTASDYGKQLIISRVPKTDQILYQTERYHHATFGYEIPVNKDGDYVLVLKFCEVYFSSPGMKVFDVTLNGVHTVVSDLDIFGRVGRGVAHDERVPFRVEGNRLLVRGEESEHDGKIRVEFVKGYRDNPKINAIYVVRGAVTDVPDLPLSPLKRRWGSEEDAEGKVPHHLAHLATPLVLAHLTLMPPRTPIPCCLFSLPWAPFCLCFSACADSDSGSE